MKVLMISGSRNPQGQTAAAANAVLMGAEAAGAEVERMFLPTLDVQRCRQCEDSGWGICRSEGQCVIEDDFADIVDKVREADAVVFATPVYFSDLSESMRAFTDRLRRICMHDAGKVGIADKRAVGVCVAGGGGGGAPECTASLKKVLSRAGFDMLDMVPVRRQNREHKQGVLELTGRWLVK
jgi:multimeric flavodoxin WrbA